MSQRQRQRQRGRGKLAPSKVELGPPAKITEPLGVEIPTDKAIRLTDIEKGVKLVLAMLLYYDPTTKRFYPAESPKGIPETVVKAYKPDTNTFEYLRLDPNYRLYVVEYYASNIWNNLASPRESHIYDADETVDQEITLDLNGRSALGVYAEASAATTFILEGSVDNSKWFEVKRWENVTKVNDVFKFAFRYARLKSLAAGASGDKVTLILTAKGC